MKLYHGSPKKLRVIKPNKRAEGIVEFESNRGIFLTDSKKLASLYALGKTLKGKTRFGYVRNKLIIVGDYKPKLGYVYEVNVKAKKFQRAQYVYDKEIKKFKTYKVNPKDFEKDIIYVGSEKELFNLVKKDIKRTLKIARNTDLIKSLKKILSRIH